MLSLRTRRLSRISTILFVLKSYARYILWKMCSSETLSSSLSLSLLIRLLPFWGFSEKDEECSSSRVSALLSISPEGDSLCWSSVSLVVLVSLILLSGLFCVVIGYLVVFANLLALEGIGGGEQGFRGIGFLWQPQEENRYGISRERICVNFPRFVYYLVFIFD